MAGNKGLGRGYASLLGLNDVDELVKGSTTSADVANKEGAEILLSLSDIDPNYEQPRKIFDETALNELAQSIATHGVIQPIVVTPIGKRFMIIAGERRFRASKSAGKTQIPAIIKHYTPQQIKEISIINSLPSCL